MNIIQKYKDFLLEAADIWIPTKNDFVKVNGYVDGINFKDKEGMILYLNTETYEYAVKFPNKFDTKLHTAGGEDNTHCSYYIPIYKIKLSDGEQYKKIQHEQELKSIKNKEVDPFGEETWVDDM